MQQPILAAEHQDAVGAARTVERPRASDAGTDDTSLLQYEHECARRTRSRRAVAFGHARTALAAIFRAADLRPGDEVLLSPLTCKVVPLAILSLQLKPIFVDISQQSLNLDASGLPALVSSRTRAVLFQHTYGSPAGLDQVAAWSDANGMLLVEDCAQCVPLARDTPSHRRGRAAVYSNNLLKPLPAASGGLAVTDDDALARRIEHVRDQCPMLSNSEERRLKVAAWIHDRLLGPRSYWTFLGLYQRVDAGYTPRPAAAEIQTEIQQMAHRPSAYQLRRGLRWLERLDDVAAQRRSCTADYARALKDMPHVVVPLPDSSLPLYYFPVLVRNKTALLDAARRRSLEVIAWPRRTPIYPVDDAGQLAQYGYRAGSCPIAELVASRLVGLPTHGKVASRHRAAIVDLIKDHA